ncbi:hypothetical protein X975_21395, partial [Stegodyphus mimosarum]
MHQRQNFFILHVYVVSVGFLMKTMIFHFVPFVFRRSQSVYLHSHPLLQQHLFIHFQLLSFQSRKLK